MKDTTLLYTVPYEDMRREQVEITTGFFHGYEKVDCIRFTHYELPRYRHDEKEELGVVTIPLSDLPFTITHLLSIVIESKDLDAIKYINEHRLAYLIKKMDEFKAIKWEA